MIYKPPCVMFLMGAVLRGKVGGVGPWKSRVFWALWNDIDSIGEGRLGPKKLEISRAQPPPTCPSSGSARIKNNKNNYAQGRINHRCIVVLCTKLIRNQHQTVKCIVSHQWCDLFHRLLHSYTRHIERGSRGERDIVPSTQDLRPRTCSLRQVRVSG